MPPITHRQCRSERRPVMLELAIAENIRRVGAGETPLNLVA
jgi:hypothetical protein